MKQSKYSILRNAFLVLICRRLLYIHSSVEKPMSSNYFNTLNLRQQLDQLGRCRFMDRSEFESECDYLKGKKIVIIGCGAQGLNQGLNMRDSGLDVSYTLRAAAIAEKRQSWKRSEEHTSETPVTSASRMPS